MPRYGSGPAAGVGADWGNPDWDSAAARFLVVRLSGFADVERSTPHQFLFREIRGAMPKAYIDFAFFSAGRRDSARSAAGLASSRPGSDFDVILVSNSYTLELINLAPWLKAAGLGPTRSSREAASREAASREDAARKAGPRYPIVALGGSNAMASSAAYDESSGDSLVDAVFFGEGEGRVGALAAGLASASLATGQARAEALERLAGEVPGFWPTASRRSVVQAKSAYAGYQPAPPPRFDGDEAGTVRLEITKGCPGFCSFCFEGWERKPYRELSLDAILAEARALKRATGADSVELASYNFNAHSRVVDVIRGLHGLFLNVGFQSQRADMLAEAPGLARFEIAAGKRSFTVGVEGISARIRAYYAKELSEAELRKVLSELCGRAVREIKLFYILSGFEGEADFAEFGRFVSWLATVSAGGRPGSAPRVIFSAGPLIRMPFTPLAYERLILDEGAFSSIVARVSSAVAAAGFEFREPGSFDEYCLSQALALPPAISAIPRSPGGAASGAPATEAPRDIAPGSGLDLLLALASRGYVYDGSLSKGAWDFARKRLESLGALGPGYLGEKGSEYPFPYAFVEPAVSRSAAYRRFLSAKSGLEPGSCLGAGCEGCGACDPEERAAIEGHALDSASEADIAAVEALVAAKRKPFVVRVRGSIPRELAGARPAYLAAAFRRRLYAASPGLVDTVWTARDLFLKADEGEARLPGAYGDTVIEIASSRPLGAGDLAAAGLEPVAAVEPPTSLTVEALFPSVAVRTAASLISAFLNAASIPHTLSTSCDGAFIDVSAKGKKKRNVSSVEVRPLSLGSTGADTGRPTEAETGADTGRPTEAETGAADAGGTEARIAEAGIPEAGRAGAGAGAVAVIACGAKADLAGLVELARRKGHSLELGVSWKV